MPKTIDIITPILCFGILSSLGIGVYSRSKYRALVEKAEKIAETRIGDGRAPLSDLEKTSWYQTMNVKENEEPTLEQLRDYIGKYSNN